MRRILLTGLALALVSSNVHADPLELKGLRLGMTADEAASVMESKSNPRAEILMNCGSDICISRHSFPFGGGTGSVLSYLLRDGVVGYITVDIKRNDFAIVRAALVEKYGQPTSREVREYRNKFGATTTGEVLTWRDEWGGEDFIEVHEVSGKIDRSSVILTSRTFMDRYRAEKASDAKKNAGDL